MLRGIISASAVMLYGCYATTMGRADIRPIGSSGDALSVSYDEDREEFIRCASEVIFLYQPRMPEADCERMASAIWLSGSVLGIDPYMLLGLFETESGFDTMAISSAGAMGIGQILPSVWKWACEELGMDSVEVWNMEANIFVSSFLIWDAYTRTGSMEKTLCLYSGYPYGSEGGRSYIAKVMKRTNGVCSNYGGESYE